MLVNNLIKKRRAYLLKKEDALFIFRLPDNSLPLQL